MKRFICKIFLFIVPVCALFLLFNALYSRTNYWKSENHINKFTDMPYNLELGNLGSSHTCYGINYDVAPEVKAWNLANDSQRYFWDYGVLKQYIDHFAENAVIIIPISYFGVTGRGDYSGFRKRYYRILPKESMDYWSFKENLCYNTFPLLSAGVKTIHIFHDIPKAQMSLFYNRTAHLDGENLEKSCIDRHKGWTEMDKDGGYAENIREISAIIDLCYEHKLTPVLISTPITDVLNAIYAEDEAFFPTFKQFSADLCEKYPAIRYFDYSHDERFSPNHELFADGDHLNNFGAEKFTKILVSDLQANGLL